MFVLCTTIYRKLCIYKILEMNDESDSQEDYRYLKSNICKDD